MPLPSLSKIHYQLLTLLKGPYKIKAATHEYPFEFTFPESFAYRGEDFRDEGRFKGHGGGDENGRMKLPSCVDDTNWAGEAEVCYHITAKVPLRGGRSPSPRELRRDAKQYESYHRSYRLSDEKIPRPLMKTENFKEGFKKSHETKTIHFGLAANAPTQIVIGKPYLMDLTITSKDAESLGVVLEFKLKRYDLLLKPYTDVRVLGMVFDHFSSLEGQIPLSSYLKLDAILPVNKKQTLKNFFPVQGPYQTPTFDSWCIRRWYGLELKATVEVLGEDETLKISWTGVRLLPRDMEPGVEEGLRSIADGTAGMAIGVTRREEEGEGLPAYEGGQEPAPRYEKVVDGNALGL